MKSCLLCPTLYNPMIERVIAIFVGRPKTAYRHHGDYIDIIEDIIPRSPLARAVQLRVGRSVAGQLLTRLRESLGDELAVMC